MKKSILIFTILFSFALSSGVFACTAIIVDKNVSADGSAMFGRTCDDVGINTNTIKSIAASNAVGNYTYEDVYTHLKVDLPKKHYQYFLIPQYESNKNGEWGEFGENEMGFSMSATVSLRANDVALKYDPYVTNGVSESNMARLILPYATSSNEAVKMLGDYIEKYGSAESNGVIFGDKKEIWYMEIYTGHEWAAVRCPDDKYACIPNDTILGYVDLDDTANVMASNTIYSMPEKNGFLKDLNGKHHLSLTYGKELRDYSQMRLWGSRRLFSKTNVGDYDRNKRYELFDTPKSNITLKELFKFSRYRYEDTKYGELVLDYKARAIGAENQANCLFIQIRNGKPDISWICLANSEFSVYVPLYSNINSVADEYKVDTVPYDSNCAFWKYKSVSMLCAKNREKYGKKVKETYSDLEDKWISHIADMDAEYEKTGESPDTAASLFLKVSKEAFAAADKLFKYIITDMSAEQNDITHDAENNIG